MPADELFQSLRDVVQRRGYRYRRTGRARPQPREVAGAFELHRVGDAVASRNIAAAILDSLRLCRLL